MAEQREDWQPLPEPRKLALVCGCISHCFVSLIVEWDGIGDDPRHWWLEWYEQVGTPRRLKDRFRLLWAIVRGKDTWRHGLVLNEPEVDQLRAFLATPWPTALHTTASTGTKVTYGPASASRTEER